MNRILIISLSIVLIERKKKKCKYEPHAVLRCMKFYLTFRKLISKRIEIFFFTIIETIIYENNTEDNN